LESVNLAANQIAGGSGDSYISGGVESMSRTPMMSDGGAVGVDPSFTFDNYFVPQGIGADIIATEHGFDRDSVDEYAVESQKRAKIAWNENYFSSSIVPVRDINGLLILDKDEYMRPTTDMQTLGALKPAFKEQGELMPGFDKVAMMKYPHLEKINHVHHAGNSSGIVDGSAAILLGNKEFGAKWGLKARAKIKGTAKIGTDPTIMLTGPINATEKVLTDTKLSIKDIDLFEVNEAFASVALLFLKAFDVDSAKVNPNGGAIAMGHPLGATGTMILGTLLDELERTDKELGLATLCVASGMGAATVIERV
jgi:acetyl-CoA C-acetyltransferase